MRRHHPILLLPSLLALASLTTFSLITLAAVLLSTLLLQYELRQLGVTPPPVAGKDPGKIGPKPLDPTLPATRQKRNSVFTVFTYFVSNLAAFLLIGLIPPNALLALCWLNVLVVPYVLFTVYYGRRAVKQWGIVVLGLPIVLAGAPLIGPNAPFALKIITLLVFPFLAARLQCKTRRGMVFSTDKGNTLVMSNQSISEKDRKDKEKETGIRQPDPETLHTTDPQEHMKGPISSLMQKVKDKAESNNEDDRNDPELQTEEHTSKKGYKTK